MNDNLINISGMNRPAIAAVLAELGVPEKQLKMRSQQIAHWMYYYGATGFDEMTNITKDFRAELAQGLEISRPEITTAQISEDGTRKWLLKLAEEIAS